MNTRTALVCGAMIITLCPTAKATEQAVEARLAQQERAFQRWRWAWVGIYTGLTVGNLVLAPFTARRDRIDLYVGAASSAVAIPPLFIFTQPRLDEPPCALESRLACAEQKLYDVAAFQREARGWVPHVATFVVNAAAGAVLGFGYGRWRSAALTFGIGMAIGEVQIFTQPRGALP
jgi:hypothetical protein